MPRAHVPLRQASLVVEYLEAAAGDAHAVAPVVLHVGDAQAVLDEHPAQAPDEHLVGPPLPGHTGDVASQALPVGDSIRHARLASPEDVLRGCQVDAHLLEDLEQAG